MDLVMQLGSVKTSEMEQFVVPASPVWWMYLENQRVVVSWVAAKLHMY